jgi:hypothetical protein
MIYRSVTLNLYERVMRYPFKKNIPVHLRAFEPVRVNFGLWGVWYVPRVPEGLAGLSGAVPFHIAHTIDHGPLIGPHDAEAAAGKPYAEAWRESYHAAIQSRLNLTVPELNPEPATP